MKKWVFKPGEPGEESDVPMSSLGFPKDTFMYLSREGWYMKTNGSLYLDPKWSYVPAARVPQEHRLTLLLIGG